MLRCTAGAAMLLLVPALAHGSWKGEAGAGLLTTSGNSETESFNGKLLLDVQQGAWKNSFSASAINTGDEEGRSAERYTVADELEYLLTERDYLFGAIDWEKDLFGGFRERMAETAGYGRHILLGPVHTLDAAIGAGARQTEEQDTGDRQKEAVGRVGGKYGWTISQTSSFSQTVKVEYGKDNTFTEAVSELKLSIIGNLFASLSFTARNNSDVSEDSKSTDTFTAINISYTFGNT